MELILFVLIGWLVGALVNRAADNLPVHRSLLAAPQCPYCGTLRPVFDQLAMLRFLLWRGCCSNCHAPIMLRAPLVEIANASAYIFLWARYGTTMQWLLMAIYTTVFLLVIVTDLEHRLIFNIVILPAILFAALASPFSQLGIARSLVGGAMAFVIVFAIYVFAKIFARVRGLKIAGGVFGQSDVSLATFVGIVTGFPAVLSALLYAILLAGAGALLLLVYQFVVYRRLALYAVFPYGPFFCIAGWLVMVFG
jgi:leader peptidase (prepilin peptidase)/N-methyltransferase